MDNNSGTNLGTESNMKRGLKARHINMIAIGGTIGTGLFLASSYVVSKAGSGGGPLAYIMIGVLVYFLMRGLGEMTSHLQLAGTIPVSCDLYVHPALGFAVGWNYFINACIGLGAELVASSVLMKQFAPNVPAVYWCIFFGALILFLNLISVKLYGEAEFWFAGIKVATIVIFLIVGVLLILGIIGGGKAVGVSNWTSGGFMPAGIWGVIAVAFGAIFSFSGVETIATAAGETENPSVNIPRAVKTITWRILLFYVGTMIVVGLAIPYDKIGVTNNAFAAIFKMAGFPILALAMNIVILTSIVSCANSTMYVCSRIAYSMALDGKAPKFLGKLTKNKVPMNAILVTMLLSLVCLAASFVSPDKLYVFLMSLNGFGVLFTWFGISLAHFRFRKCIVRDGGKLEDIKFKAPLYPFGSLLVMIALAIIGIGMYTSASTRATVYTGAPLLVIYLLVGKWMHSKGKLLKPNLTINGKE